MNKELHKAIMARSQLRKNFLKGMSEGYRKAYNKQRNVCASSYLKKPKGINSQT